MSGMLIHHGNVAEFTEIAENGGETLVDWALRTLAMRGEHGPFGWRVLPCGCLVIEPLDDAIANFSATQESAHVD